MDLPSPFEWTEGAVGLLINRHLSHYPLMELQDAYKLLYQAALGPEHLISTGTDFMARLQAEMASLPPYAGESLWEIVRPDGALGRVNLRPFVAQAGDVNKLATACLHTAEQTWGTRHDLAAAWSHFELLVERGAWSVFTPSALSTLSKRLARQGYPALHHSTRYKRAYCPAYRVVSAAHARMAGITTEL